MQCWMFCCYCCCHLSDFSQAGQVSSVACDAAVAGLLLDVLDCALNFLLAPATQQSNDTVAYSSRLDLLAVYSVLLFQA